MQYTSLRTSTHFSCGLGFGDQKYYIKTAKEKGLGSLVVTDFSSIAGALEFYNEGKKQGLPIGIGSQFYIDFGGKTSALPVSLIAENKDGYINLCRLVTCSNRNNRVLNIQDLYDYSDNLFCIAQDTGCKKYLLSIFKDKLFYEISFYPDTKDRVLDICKNINPNQIVISSDAYMPNESDKVFQDIMIENSSYSKDDKSFPFAKYMMSLEETLKCFSTSSIDVPQSIIIEAIKNSVKISTLCSKIKLEFKDQLVNYPHFLHPLNTDNCSKEALLRRIIKDNNRWDQSDPIYKERLEYEIDTIAHNSRIDLTDYFLVNEDLCRYCRNNDVPVGPGRGSAAGSLVSYGLMITHLDPIKYNLLFERFLSKGRVESGTLPDIDIDFANQEVVREYLTDLYGHERVAPIGTFQTLAVRGAIKDSFRALYPDVDFWTINSINKLLDDKIEADDDRDLFENNYKNNEEFRKSLDKFPKIVEVITKLVGSNRQAGQHPCGLAITQDPIEDFIPLRVNKGKDILEFSANSCEQSGVIKYDILGLKTLKFFQSCLRSIDSRYKDSDKSYPKIIYDIPLDDQDTYNAFMLGDTESVFQFNSNVAKAILTNIKISSLDDLSMVTSVGRPGPMKNNQHNNFMKRKNGEVLPTPPHPALEELLKDTFGIMIYQESVMRCAQLMGGYSLAETDNIRKAMGKKDINILMPFKKGFIEHCQEKYPDTTKFISSEEDDTPVSIAENIWNLMETFSGYGFNKSHSMSYTLIGYYCQYFKVHYPLEWWSACLGHAGSPEHVKDYYSACKEYVKLPTINGSKDTYFIEYGDKNSIIMPFGSVKGVGSKASKAIQESAPYVSFEDFFTRVNKRACNKRVVANLIFAGAFDCFETDKEKLLLEYYTLRKDKKVPPEHQNITRDFELESKYEVMDFLTLDYIDLYKDILHSCKYPSDIKDLPTGETVNIVGKIANIKNRKIKNGKNAGAMFHVMDVLNKDDLYDVIVWPDQIKLFKHNIKEKEVVVISGISKKDWNDKAQVTAKSVHSIKEIRQFGGLGL